MDIQRLTHLGICVSNLDRSLRFYRDVLGCKEVGRLAMEGGAADTLNAIEGVKLRAIYLERDGWRLELIEFPEPGWIGPKAPRPMNQLGLTHLSLRVDDLDAIVREFEEAGVDVRQQTRIDVPEANAKAVFITDPDGTLIELVERPGD